MSDNQNQQGTDIFDKIFGSYLGIDEESLKKRAKEFIDNKEIEVTQFAFNELVTRILVEQGLITKGEFNSRYNQIIAGYLTIVLDSAQKEKETLVNTPDNEVPFKKQDIRFREILIETIKEKIINLLDKKQEVEIKNGDEEDEVHGTTQIRIDPGHNSSIGNENADGK